MMVRRPTALAKALGYQYQEKSWAETHRFFNFCGSVIFVLVAPLIIGVSALLITIVAVLATTWKLL